MEKQTVNGTPCFEAERSNIRADFNENSWDAMRHFESSIWPSTFIVATAARWHSVTQCHLWGPCTPASHRMVAIFFLSPIVQVSESPGTREFKQHDSQREMPKHYQGNVIPIKQRCFQTPSSPQSVTTCRSEDLGKRQYGNRVGVIWKYLGMQRTCSWLHVWETNIPISGRVSVLWAISPLIEYNHMNILKYKFTVSPV